MDELVRGGGEVIFPLSFGGKDTGKSFGAPCMYRRSSILDFITHVRGVCVVKIAPRTCFCEALPQTFKKVRSEHFAKQ